jgi:hypothetical protein
VFFAETGSRFDEPFPGLFEILLSNEKDGFVIATAPFAFSGVSVHILTSVA